MKKLLKNEICGSINSAQMHCSQTKSQQMRLPKKKKKAETCCEQNAGS